jgi:hypothetical protein
VRPVLVGFQGDVVAEPLRLLVRIRVAADVDEERGVVDICSLVVIEAELLSDAQRDQALAQHVLHRLPEAEVDPERQRRDELGQPNWRRCGVADRARGVRRSLRERSLGSHDGTRDPRRPKELVVHKASPSDPDDAFSVRGWSWRQRARDVIPRSYDSTEEVPG